MIIVKGLAMAETASDIEERRRWAIDRAISIYERHGTEVHDCDLIMTAQAVYDFAKDGTHPPKPY